MSPFAVEAVDEVDPFASYARPRGLGERDFDFLLGMCDAALSKD